MALSKLKISNHHFKIINDEFQSFVSQKGRLSVFVTGKTGVGKTRLANALLGEQVAIEGQLKKACTSRVNSYCTNIEGTAVHVYDMPGLQDGKSQDEFYLESLSNEVRKGLDVMLYCIKMDDRRFHTEDKNAIRALTKKFGQDVWKNAIIALTFANKIEDPDHPDGNQEEQELYFQRECEYWREEVDAFFAELGVDSKIYQAIPRMPVGNYLKPQLPTIANWLSDFWNGCFRRMSDSSRMNLYRINKSRLSFTGAANMEAACSLANEEEKQTGLAAEPDTTQTTQSDDDVQNIPIKIPFNKKQQEQFWRKTWDAFHWFCIHVIKRPEVIEAVVDVGYEGLRSLFVR